MTRLHDGSGMRGSRHGWASERWVTFFSMGIGKGHAQVREDMRSFGCCIPQMWEDQPTIRTTLWETT